MPAAPRREAEGGAAAGPCGAAAEPGALAVRAPAKINLYLGVHDQRDAAGYHRVDSVMAALSLADEVHAVPARELSVTMSAVDAALEPLPALPQEKNSAHRAAVAMGRAFGRVPLVSLHIYKRVPLQAGLGGPSADAAAAIAALCALWGVDPADARTVAAARSIGADVPFFLGSSPAYLAGRGDELVEAFPQAPAFPVALVKPRAGGVSTPAAYRLFDEAPAARGPLEPLRAALREGRAEEVPPLVANNLAPAARALEPQVAEVLAWLGAQPGVLAADVCGSGACCFALCADADDARRIARDAREEHGGAWWSCATRMENCGARPIAG